MIEEPFKINKTLENLGNLALFELEFGDYNKVAEYAMKILEQDSKCDFGWLLKSISTKIDDFSISDYLRYNLKCLRNIDKTKIKNLELIVYLENRIKYNLLSYIKKNQELLVITNEFNLDINNLNQKLTEIVFEINKTFKTDDDFYREIEIAIILLMFEIPNISIDYWEEYDSLSNDKNDVFWILNDSDTDFNSFGGQEEDNPEVIKEDYMNILKIKIDFFMYFFTYYNRGLLVLKNFNNKDVLNDYEINNINKSIADLTTRLKSTVVNMDFNSNEKQILRSELKEAQLINTKQINELKHLFDSVLSYKEFGI